MQKTYASIQCKALNSNRKQTHSIEMKPRVKYPNQIPLYRIFNSQYIADCGLLNTHRHSLYCYMLYARCTLIESVSHFRSRLYSALQWRADLGLYAYVVVGGGGGSNAVDVLPMPVIFFFFSFLVGCVMAVVSMCFALS